MSEQTKIELSDGAVAFISNTVLAQCPHWQDGWRSFLAARAAKIWELSQVRAVVSGGRDMTDIVERLRVPCACGLGLREEAANEIERLRAALEDAVETLEAVNLHGDNPLYNRLRAALENKP